MPEIDSRVRFLKESMRDFFNFIEEKTKKERSLTRDLVCRRVMDEIAREAEYQKKLFGII